MIDTSGFIGTPPLLVLGAANRQESRGAVSMHAALGLPADHFILYEGVGALGLYSSHLVDWRKEREAGEFAGLTPAKRGRKPSKDSDPSAVELARLRRENARLEDELRKASIVIDVQKKVALLLGNPIGSPRSEDESR